MIRALLKRFGFEIIYVCGWGNFEYRYTHAGWFDAMMLRIPPNTTMAPPWAKMKLRRITPTHQSK